MNNQTLHGIMVASPRSGVGKTTLTLALIRALKNTGINVVSAKSGPDFIDPQFHEAASGNTCINLDAWAMSPQMIDGLVANLTSTANFLIVEGAMGLFDSAQDGNGSAADLATRLNIPIVLVVDCSMQGQSVGAIVHGFNTYRQGIEIAGVILNRVASDRHDKILRSALKSQSVKVLGTVFRNESLTIPERHLGLVQALEHDALNSYLENAAELVQKCIDLDGFQSLARQITVSGSRIDLPPLGQNIAIARDHAFSFSYPHILEGWKQDGVNLMFFSPLEDEPPPNQCDAIYLPGGYPELYGPKLASALKFKDGMKKAAENNVLIYGECGGYMSLGQAIIDKKGSTFPMLGLLPHSTSFADQKLHLGYRIVSAVTNFPWQKPLAAHEFHYATLLERGKSEYFFEVKDATGKILPNIGNRSGSVMGSFVHVICSASIQSE